MPDSKRLSGRSVIVGFFLLVAVVGGGLWLALDAARDTFLAESNNAEFNTPVGSPSISSDSKMARTSSTSRTTTAA